jgi:hypothetical protein
MRLSNLAQRCRSADPYWLAVPVLLVSLASGPALAQEYPSRAVGGWTVAASKDAQGCFLTRTFAGPGNTTLLLGIDVDKANHLSVLNDNWSIKPKEKWKLTFRMSKGGYPNHAVVGMASGGQNGFVTSFDDKFPGHFAASTALHIYRGDVPVEQLSLSGSGAAVAELRRCVALHATKSTGAGTKGPSGRIPRDPFAPNVGRKRKD